MIKRQLITLLRRIRILPKKQIWGQILNRYGKVIALCRKENDLYNFYDPNGSFLFKSKNFTVKLATTLIENKKLGYIQ